MKNKKDFDLSKGPKNPKRDLTSGFMQAILRFSEITNENPNTEDWIQAVIAEADSAEAKLVAAIDQKKKFEDHKRDRKDKAKLFEKAIDKKLEMFHAITLVMLFLAAAQALTFAVLKVFHVHDFSVTTMCLPLAITAALYFLPIFTVTVIKSILSLPNATEQKAYLKSKKEYNYLWAYSTIMSSHKATASNIRDYNVLAAEHQSLIDALKNVEEKDKE